MAVSKVTRIRMEIGAKDEVSDLRCMPTCLAEHVRTFISKIDAFLHYRP